MKLAEALLIRADQKKKILSLRERIAKNALVQEGSQPREAVAALIRECFATIAAQQELVLRIDVANTGGKLADGRALPQALAERDVLKQQHATLKQAVDAAQKDVSHYSAREIKWLAQIDVATTQKQMEDLAIKIRDLNIKIQEANWCIALPE